MLYRLEFWFFKASVQNWIQKFPFTALYFLNFPNLDVRSETYQGCSPTNFNVRSYMDSTGGGWNKNYTDIILSVRGPSPVVVRFKELFFELVLWESTLVWSRRAGGIFCQWMGTVPTQSRKEFGQILIFSGKSQSKKQKMAGRLDVLVTYQSLNLLDNISSPFANWNWSQ